MKNILVDTNVLIDYSKGQDDFLERLFEMQKNRKVELFVNPIIITEFYTDNQLLDPVKEQRANHFFMLFQNIDLSAAIGRYAGVLLREKKCDYLADALIAAFCFVKKLILATNNVKHFKNIPSLKLLSKRNLRSFSR